MILWNHNGSIIKFVGFRVSNILSPAFIQDLYKEVIVISVSVGSSYSLDEIVCFFDLSG